MDLSTAADSTRSYRHDQRLEREAPCTGGSSCSDSDGLKSRDSMEDTSSWTQLGLSVGEGSDESFSTEPTWTASSVVEDILHRCNAELASAAPLSERSVVLQRALSVHGALMNKEPVIIPGFQVAGFPYGELSHEAMVHLTVEEHMQLWQSLQRRLASALQAQRGTCVMGELNALLGLAMGLCLALMACNPAAMLRLQEAKSQGASKAAPCAGWANVLGHLELSGVQIAQIFALRRVHWQRLGAAVRAQEQAHHALQAAVQRSPASGWPCLERAGFLDTALRAGAALEQALQLQASILLERMGLMDEPHTLTPRQVAALIVHADSHFPDVVALGEALAQQQGGQPSMEALGSLASAQ